MAERPEIAPLIERLEKASEGSRKLDAEIAVCLRIGTPDLPDWAFINFPVWRPREDGRVEVVHETGTGGVHWKPDPFTTSLDAALTLVPEGTRVRELGQWWDIDKPGGWFCNVMRWEYDGQLNLIERAYTFGFAEDDRMPRTAPTPALALCIAALKARAEAAPR